MFFVEATKEDGAYNNSPINLELVESFYCDDFTVLGEQYSEIIFSMSSGCQKTWRYKTTFIRNKDFEKVLEYGKKVSVDSTNC